MTHPKYRDWSSRYTVMGDKAEQAFRDWSAQNGIAAEDYGLRRPPFNYFRYIPAEIRHTPDFLCEQTGKPPRFDSLRSPNGRFARHFFVETKGCGRDQKIKIKHDEFDILRRWETFSCRPVVIFVYDSHNERVSSSLTLDELDRIKETMTTGYFHDGGNPKPYWAIDTDALEWEEFIVSSNSSDSSSLAT